MVNMVDAVEGARPVMEYIRMLENRVRHYETVERKFNFGCFALGIIAGGGLVSLVWLLLVLLKLKGT